MKKRFALIPALAALTLFALVGCAATPPPEPAPTPSFEPAPEETVWEPAAAVAMSSVTIHFGPNSADLARVAAEMFADNERGFMDLARAFNENSSLTLRIEGHANPVRAPGTPQRTAEMPILQTLSEARARAVLERLVALGIDRARLTAVGLGGTNPLASFDSRDEWWRNRRVQIVPVQ